jgi:hypothetical protein
MRTGSDERGSWEDVLARARKAENKESLITIPAWLVVRIDAELDGAVTTRAREEEEEGSPETTAEEAIAQPDGFAGFCLRLGALIFDLQQGETFHSARGRSRQDPAYAGAIRHLIHRLQALLS